MIIRIKLIYNLIMNHDRDSFETKWLDQSNFIWREGRYKMRLNEECVTIRAKYRPE